MRLTTRRNSAGRGGDEDEGVGVAPRLPGSNSGRDQAGGRQQGEPERRESCPRLDRGLLERPHRRVERGRTPEEVVRDPADVVDQLVVVRVRQQGVGVRRIDGQQADDAREEEVERRRALPLVDREPDRGGEEQEVPEGVGGGDRLLERRQAGEMDVRCDQEDPGDQARSRASGSASRSPPPCRAAGCGAGRAPASPPPMPDRRAGRERRQRTGTRRPPRRQAGSCTCTCLRRRRGTGRG